MTARFVTFGVAFMIGAAVVVACGSDGDSTFPGSELQAGPIDPGGGSSGSSSFGGTTSSSSGTSGQAGCKNLQCKQVACAGGGKTTVSGTVYAPTPAAYGPADPIYNAIVYVPNGTPEAFKPGATCDKCGTVASGEPLVTALSGANGKFVIENVPVGTDIPLVIQVGRWRRQVKIPKVAECTDTPLDKELTRLPRSKAEGDIPLMAIATSPYDPTECIMRKIGIADEEFTVPSASGRVHIYKGAGATLAGATPPASTTLWQTPANLAKYDIVAFPCQTSGGPDAAGRANIQTYADTGGRVFVTDLSQDVVKLNTAWAPTANWSVTGSYTNPATIDQTFPKGKALADWLSAIGATPTPGQMNLTGTYARFTSAIAPAQRWVYSATTSQTYSFNTPVGAAADAQCGRVVYSSFHIASGAGASFPSECTSAPLTAQEKVLEFLLFDLSSCIQKDDTAPVPPPPVVK